MPKGVYVRTLEYRLSRKGKPLNHKANCQCGVCQAKRGEPHKHIRNCKCPSCKNKRGEIRKHKSDCKCCACKSKRGELSGVNHYRWKGKDVGKKGIHDWLRKTYGNADHCENPKCSGRTRNFEWSNKKKHKYRRNRKDFQQLCKICHRLFDLGKLKI